MLGLEKNTDLDALETGLSSDEDETSGSQSMTESNLKDNVKDNVFREGYHQAYFVRKPSRNTTRRNVFVRCGVSMLFVAVLGGRVYPETFFGVLLHSQIKKLLRRDV